MFSYEPPTGVKIELEDFWEMKDRGIVFVGKLTGLPDGKRSMASGDLQKLLIGQTLFFRKIKGVELFATLNQHTGRGVGLLLESERVSL